MNKAEQVRKTILSVAEGLFFANGVARTSLEMIAREGRITRGAVYWHFKDKSEVLTELVSLVRPNYNEIEKQLASDNQSDSLTKLFDFCVRQINTYMAPGRAQRVMTILMYKCEFTRDLVDFQRREKILVGKTIALVERIFEDQCTRLHPGITPKSASLQLHYVYYGVLRSVLRERALFEPMLDTRLVFSLYFKALLQGWN